MFTFEVNKNNIELTEAETITSGSVNVYFCHFVFSSDWNGLVKTVTFRAGDVSISVILDSTNMCTIPWEVLEHDAVQLYAGVRGTVTGTDTEEEAIIPTVYCLLGTIRKGTELGDNAQPPSPSIVEQIMNKLETLDEEKQDKLTGSEGQVVSFDEYGNVISRNEKGTEYKAGESISISADNTISAKMYNDTEIRGEIDNVKSKTEANTEAIAANSADIAANAAGIAANAEAIAKNTADISKNAENIAKNTESIAGNAANIAKNSADIAKNTAGLKTVGDKVDTLNTSFSTLSKSVTDNTAAINTAEENIAALSLSVTEAGREIAKNAAGLSAANEEISTLKDSKQDKLHGNEGQVVGFDEFGNAIAQDGGTGTPGKDGVTFTPMVSESGIISWSNDGGRENPEPMNIKGPKGDKGDPGEQGLQGLQGPKGDTGDTGPAGTYTAGTGITISNNKISASYQNTRKVVTIASIGGTVYGTGFTINSQSGTVYRTETLGLNSDTSGVLNLVRLDGVFTVDMKVNTSSLGDIYVRLNPVEYGVIDSACGFAVITYTPYNSANTATIFRPAAFYKYSNAIRGIKILKANTTDLSIDNSKALILNLYLG